MWLSMSGSKTFASSTMAAMNEERYCVETRSTIVSSAKKFQNCEYVADYFDGMEFLVGEVTMDRFNDTVFEPYEEQKIETVVGHTETISEMFTEPIHQEPEEKTDVAICTDSHAEELKVDVSTNTVGLTMVNKVTGTDVIRFNMATSTAVFQYDMATSTEGLKGIRSRHDVATSTDNLQENSRPLASVEEADTDYWSANFNNLQRTLPVKLNNIRKENNEKNNLDTRSSCKCSTTIMSDSEISNVHCELNRLANERIDIIELLVVNIGNLSSSLTVELLETKLNYSMGQTDQLLAMLEESWRLESSSPSNNEQMLHIVQKIILQSRAELNESKRAIKTYLDEVKFILGDGHRRRALYAEIMRMKRRAEIEAFKLERMWEQLFYERSKKKESYLRSYLSRSVRAPSREPSTEAAVNVIQNYTWYLSDLRERNVLAAAEEELNDLRQQTPHLLLPDHPSYHHDNGWDTSSIASTSSRSSYLSPRMHKDHLIELRRQIVASTNRETINKSSPESSSPDYFSPDGTGYKPTSRHTVK